MISSEKLGAAYRRTALYYLNLLHEMNQAYLSGGENTWYALQRFEADYNQIERCIEWLEHHLTENIESERLFIDMVAAGQYILSRRLKPVNYLHLHEKALHIAEQLQDTSAALTHLRAIAHAYQLSNDTAQLHDILLETYDRAKKADNTEQVATALYGLSSLYLDWGQYNDALHAIQDALYHYQLLNDTSNVGKSLIFLGKINLFKGNWDEAEFYFNEAYTIAIHHNYHEHLSQILRNLGEVKGCLGLYDEAIAYQSRALEIASRLNDYPVMIPLLLSLGNWHDCKSDYATAQTYHFRVLQLIEQTGIYRYKSTALCFLGVSLSLQEDNAAAVGYLEQALQMCRDEQEITMICITLAYLAPIYAKLGMLEKAQCTLREELEIALDTNNKQLQLQVVVTAINVWIVLAKVQVNNRTQQWVNNAAQWFGLMFTLPNVKQEHRDELIKLRPALETTLGQEQFNELLRQGEQLNLQEVLSHLQGELKHMVNV